MVTPIERRIALGLISPDGMHTPIAMKLEFTAIAIISPGRLLNLSFIVSESFIFIVSKFMYLYDPCRLNPFFGRYDPLLLFVI